MSDFEKLINASDLIEWIMETYPDWCEGAVRGIVDHVDDLPSAQPEIIRCKDCLMHGVCRFEQGLGLDGYCSKAERRTDG